MANAMLRVLTLSILWFLSFEAGASTSGSDPFGALTPLDNIVDFFTGSFGLKLVILGLVAAGVMWWKSREDMGEKLFTVIKWAVGGALVLGAPDIVTALGFASATV